MNNMYDHIKKLLLGTAGMVMLVSTARSQSANAIKAGFDNYAHTVMQEKVYAHTDRQYYLAGELLWFKLYTVDAGTNKPLDVSKVAYVDILDAANAAVLQGVIPLKGGSGAGSLYLPVTLANGNYKLRAYTNWMKNFSPELYFEKQLTIVNSLLTPEAAKTPPAGYDIRFFPEGGNLVNGLAGTVGFKATGADGHGVNISGAVTDQRNDTVARFRSAKFGMGRFSFTPAANNTYKATIRIGGTVIVKDLPAAAAQGYVMHVADNGNKQLQVAVSGTGNEALYLLVHSGNAVSVAQMIDLGSGHNNTITIDKDKLGDGISHITLFNAQRQPVCERLYFKRPTVAALQVSTQPQYGSRKRVLVDIAAKSSSGMPQMSDLSMAVYHADQLNKISSEDITSYLWLTSELKGNIETPSYYFDHVDAGTDLALDNLLLTQGWVRFNWDQVLSASTPAFRFLPEYNGRLITGQITDRNGAPANNMVVYMGAKDSKVQLYGANSNRSGQLLFNTRNLYGTNEMVLQINTQLDTNTYHINIDSPFSGQYSGTPLPAFSLSKDLNNQLESNSLAMQVQNLYRPENMRRVNTAAMDTSSFYEGHYAKYLLENYTRFITIEEVLREYVKNVNVYKTGPHFHARFLTTNGYMEDTTDPLFLVDGVPVFDIDKAFAIDPLKLKRLEVVNQGYYWGPIVANGILSFTSNKNDLGGYQLDPHAIVLDNEGLQVPREFYSPVYDTPEQQSSRLPDLRNLLYWSPQVNTGADGKTQISFYTSDTPGKYIGVVQGITAGGQTASKIFTFDVSK